MTDLRQQIKKEYFELSKEDKRITGEALVKVNLGVATPSEYRIAASFLKGTGLVAKPGGLDELITLLNEDEDYPQSHPAQSTTSTIVQSLLGDDELAEQLKNFKEDSEITEKGKIKA